MSGRADINRLLQIFSKQKLSKDNYLIINILQKQYLYNEYYDMFSSDYSIDDFFVIKFKSVGKGRQMTSAVVHSNRIEGVKEDKSVELEVKKFLITFNIT